MDALRYLAGGAPGAMSMPAAVPGAGASTLGPLPGAIQAAMPSQSLPPGAVPGPFPFMPPGAMAPGPADMKYETVTQSDGTVLLHVKNPDGSLGPVVQLLKVPKLNKPPAGTPGIQ